MSRSFLVALSLVALIVAIGVEAADDHLQLSQIVVTPTGGELVEIYNPTEHYIDLSDVYLTDATYGPTSTYYYNIVTGSNVGGGDYGDFHARFPSGALIAPGEVQTVAVNGSDAYFTNYAAYPTYELFEDGAAYDDILDMVEALPGSVNYQGGLGNDGEVAILYFWDGISDLVTDLDYAVWGDTYEAVDKTGIAVDGPDPDSSASTYLNDTALASQELVSAVSHASGNAWLRGDFSEGTEIQIGGNGITGNDETSENLGTTWSELTAAPTGGPPSAARLLLSEVVVTPTLGEFVEIFNPNDFTVDLSDVYLFDATYAGGGAYYYNIVTGSLSLAGGGGSSDFHARFPDGATIAAGEYQTVAMTGSDGFFATFGVNPTYELWEDGAPDAIADMREALPGSINGQGGLNNAGEVVVLYHWNGVSDLVGDLDYLLWCDKDEAIDKTGVIIDGPDADATPSAYLDDVAIVGQDVVATSGHADGDSFTRTYPAEGAETQSGGNGVDGDDETSEDSYNTWAVLAASPNTGILTDIAVIINDVSQAEGDAGTTEFSFTVSLTKPAFAGGVTFDIATVDDTATAGADYVANSVTGAVIAEGRTSYFFNVTVNGDTLGEGNEIFLVQISNAVGVFVAVADGEGEGTILNDDPVPIFDDGFESGNTSAWSSAFP